MKSQTSVLATIILASVIVALALLKGFSVVAESVANKGIPVSSSALANLNSTVSLPGNRLAVVFDDGDESYIHLYQLDASGHLHNIDNIRIQNTLKR